MLELDYTNEERAKLLGSLLLFTRVFFKLRTNREFLIPSPTCRESHVITISRELTNVFHLKTLREYIGIPPGHFKSTFFSYFVAWAYAHYPDCQFIYTSYSHDLAAKHVANIHGIMSLPAYTELFGVKIDHKARAQDNFKTTAGGAIKAFGSSGPITGQDAGLPNLDRFTGCVLMDDMHKPDEVHSDTMREHVIRNYNETIKPRPRGNNVPILCIGQRLHEDDLPAFLMNGEDGYDWKKLILPAIDVAGNVLCPEVMSKERLAIEEKNNVYVYWSQYQQTPQPAGGGIFKTEWFELVDEDPEMLCTFITIDTAETDKTYNDATVMSFWGLYKIKNFGNDTEVIGIHSIDCLEVWVEPKDLQNTFLQFYAECSRFKTQPHFCAIEKKSTGAALLSYLTEFRGMQIFDLERNKSTGNKTKRFLDIQPYIASKLLSIRVTAKHKNNFIDHMGKITANETHRRDDIADTCADAIKLGLIDKILGYGNKANEHDKVIVQSFTSHSAKLEQARANIWR